MNAGAGPGRHPVVDPDTVLGLGGRYVFVRPDHAGTPTLSDLADAGTLTVHVARELRLPMQFSNAETMDRAIGAILCLMAWGNEWPAVTASAAPTASVSGAIADG